VDFLDNPLAADVNFEDENFERADSYSEHFDGAVNQTIARAIRDATQTGDPALQQEAASWLWICCPDIAEQVDFPEPPADPTPALAVAYIMGERGVKQTAPVM
jgi:hypothetical protein